MPRLTVTNYKNSEVDFFDNKLILKHPSVTPDGYRFLFTQSEPKYIFNDTYKSYKDVANTQGEIVEVGQIPTHQTQGYEKYDIYEKLDSTHKPSIYHAKHHSRRSVDNDIIQNGFTIEGEFLEILDHHAVVLKDGIEIFIKTILEDKTIKYEGIDKYNGHLIYTTYNYTYKS